MTRPSRYETDGTTLIPEITLVYSANLTPEQEAAADFAAELRNEFRRLQGHHQARLTPEARA